MEQQKLPNAGLVLAFGIISIISACCYGIGLLFAIIGLLVARSARKTYLESPELYTNYGTVKTGKILSIIGLILSVVVLAYIAYLVNLVGLDVLMSGDPDLVREALEDKIQ